MDIHAETAGQIKEVLQAREELMQVVFDGLPISGLRGFLYSASTLYEGYRLGEPDSYEDTYDCRTYRHYLEAGSQASDIKETLARVLHDHAINDALHTFLSRFDEREVVGIMGGHGLMRTDSRYRQVALISKKLAEKGYLMVSGGGPGAMEATDLGAWLADKEDDALDKALEILSSAPSFKDRSWLETAFRVMEAFPCPQAVSLGMPTWLYGHEPATPFATHIAKYFDNSTREDNIVTIAKGGIIYSPGSAGTMQEIFQDAVQNHYLSFGYASPMIFLGEEYWTEEMPVYRLMKHLVDKGKYSNLLLDLTDSTEEIIDILDKFRNHDNKI